MLKSRQHYRKKIASAGYIYIAGEELQFIVRDLSITGIFAEMEPYQDHSELEDVFQAIKVVEGVDIYLPEMHLAGEAEVVRSDLVDGHIYLAMEFKNIAYDVDNYLYKRRAYRKKMVAPGNIIVAGNIYPFQTQNVSIDGLMIRITEELPIKVGKVVEFDFKRLDLKGECRVIWFEFDEEGGTLIGLKYLNLERAKIKGIPSFIQ
jgi:c-di-GMP-binding flagellar brake protein YcgR